MSHRSKEHLSLIQPSLEPTDCPFDPYSLSDLVTQTLARFQGKRFITVKLPEETSHVEPYNEFMAAGDVLRSLDGVDRQRLVFSLIQQTNLTFDEVAGEDIGMDQQSIDEWTFGIAENILAYELGNQHPEVKEESQARTEEFFPSTIEEIKPQIRPLS